MSKVEKVKGAILGLAAGESVALPYIFMRSCSLLEQAPSICWNVSDFGELGCMAVAGIEAIHRHGVQWDALVRSYHKWLGRGDVELDVISAWAFGNTRIPAQLLRTREENRSIGALCSGQVLIRQIPLVISGLHWDIETLKKRVAEEVTLTHGDQEIIEAVQIFAICLWEILSGKNRVEIWDTLFEHIQSRSVYRAVLASYYEKPVGDGPNYSSALVTLQLALYHFWHDTPYVSAIRSAVFLGGATDVNAAAVGALIGAAHGMEVIPVVWRSHIFEDYENPLSQALRRTLYRAENIVTRGNRLFPWIVSKTVSARKTRRKMTSRMATHLLRIQRIPRIRISYGISQGNRLR